MITIHRGLYCVRRGRIEKDAPVGTRTVGDFKAWTRSGDYLEGTIFEDIVRYALDGSTIVRNMMQQLHGMLGTPVPKFLDGSEAVLKVKIKND